MLDAERVHRRAQEAAVLVVGLLAEDAGAQPEERGPAEVVQHHAADVDLDGRAAGERRAGCPSRRRRGGAARGGGGRRPCCRCRRRRARGALARLTARLAPRVTQAARGSSPAPAARTRSRRPRRSARRRGARGPACPRPRRRSRITPLRSSARFRQAIGALAAGRAGAVAEGLEHRCARAPCARRRRRGTPARRAPTPAAARSPAPRPRRSGARRAGASVPVLARACRAQPRARAEHVEDQHRVADVDAELAALVEARRGLRVVAEHLARRRDLDAAHEVEPRERLHLARADVGHLRVDGDVGVVVEVDRDAARRASSRSATSRATKRTGSREAADRERRQHRGVGARARSRSRGSRASPRACGR